MIIGLREVVEQYSSDIHTKFPDYATLYEHFLLYMEDSPRYNSPDKQYDVEKLFKDELTRSDIVGACIYYIKHSNASSMSAITKFLNAMTKLYKALIAKYHNETLGKHVPFSKLSDEVRREVTKNLQQVTPCAPIDKDDYKNVIDYFENHARSAEMKVQKEIIVMLILLFGFKFERIRDLRKNSVLPNFNVIRIKTESNVEIELPLPNALQKKMEHYVESTANNSEYLFANKNGKKITPAFLNHVFVRIKEITNKPDAQISATSLAKFAILEMIGKQVDFITIKEITGMDDIIINDCARIHLQKATENEKNCDIMSFIYTMEVFRALNGAISN